MRMHWIVSSGNTTNPCFAVLSNKGYIIGAETTEYGVIFSASKGNRGFTAGTPGELLGLVAMWEALGERWSEPHPDIYAEIIGALPTDDPK